MCILFACLLLEHSLILQFFILFPGRICELNILAINKPRWLGGKGYHLTGRGSGSIPGSNIYFKIKIV